MKFHNVPWRLLLNTDEKGLQSGSRKVDQKKCLVPSEAPNTIKLQSNNLQLVTVIECVTAEGVAFDPAFVFPGEGHFNAWYDVPCGFCARPDRLDIAYAIYLANPADSPADPRSANEEPSRNTLRRPPSRRAHDHRSAHDFNATGALEAPKGLPTIATPVRV